MLTATTGCDLREHVLNGHKSGAVSTLAFSDSAQLLASGGDDGRVIVWDWRANKALQSFAPNDYVRTPQGKVVAAGSTQGSSSQPAPLRDVGIHLVAFVGGADQLVSVSRDVVVYNLKDGSERARLPPSGSPEMPIQPVISNDGKCLATITPCLDEGTYWYQAKQWMIDVWDLAQLRRSWTKAIPVSASMTCLAMDGRGQYVAVAYGRIIVVWNVADATQLREFEQPENVREIAFSPDGQLLGAVDDGWNVAMWQVADGAVRITEPPRDSLGASAAGRMYFATIDFSPDGREMVAGFQCETVVYDAETGQRVSTIPTCGRVRACLDSNVVCHGSPSRGCCELRIAAFSDGRVVWRSPCLPERVTTVAVSRDCRVLASGGGWAKHRPTIRVWEIER